MNGEQKLNIYELAKITGFSVSTVSKALNNTGRISENTRKLILDKASELNYVASYHAKALSMKKTWLIAIIFADDLWNGFSHPYFSVILEHFKRRVEEEGYEVTFINRNMGKSEMTYLEFCKYRNVDGVFVVNAYSLSKQIPELVEAGIPIVSADAGGLNIPTITSNDYLGGTMATEYLLGLNHKKIYHLAGPQYTESGLKRANGYKDIMEKNNLESKVFEAYNYDFDNGYQAAFRMIESGSLPTALFVGGDWLALGAIKAFREHNIQVPEEISVIGYDDLEFVKYTTPALTTVSQQKEEIGKSCANFLIDQIAGNHPSVTLLDVKIIERDSCKKL